MDALARLYNEVQRPLEEAREESYAPEGQARPLPGMPLSIKKGSLEPL